MPTTLRLFNEFPSFYPYQILQTTSQQPPITRETLSELDIHRIIRNASLRHNFNFETRAQFWPKHSHERREAAKMFWAALELELALNTLHRRGKLEYDLRMLLPYGSVGRLPKVLGAIKGILKDLLRDQQAAEVEERFDVPSLLQQLERDECEIAATSDWLAKMLMSSCSPQRDLEVLSVTHKLKTAVASSSATSMVDALEGLFSILETMKLVSLPTQSLCVIVLTIAGRNKLPNPGSAPFAHRR